MKKGSIAAALLLAALLFPGCGKTAPPPETPAPTQEISPRPEPSPAPTRKPKETAESGREYAQGRELFALAASEEAARAIAEEYGIELVEYRTGVAVFHTEEDPFEVVRRGAGNGWTPIEVNRLKHSS